MKFDSIKSRLLLMTLICIIGMGLLVVSQHYFNQQHRELNQQRDTLLRLSRDLLQLRRYEKDFLLRGQMRYVDRFNQGIAEFIEALILLQPLIVKHEMDIEQTAELSATMVKYQNLFKEVVLIHRQLGLTSKDGLRARFDRDIVVLRDMSEDTQVRYLLVQAQLAQRDLLLNYNGRYAEEFQRALFALPPEFRQRQDVATLLSTLTDTMTNTSSLIQRMGETETEGIRGEFRRQAHLMESQLLSIDERVQPILDEQAQRIRMYNFLIAVLTCAVLVMVLVKSFATFHRAFSYFVMFFYQCKREYQHIDPRKLGFAEFRSLAELANEMVEARKAAERQLADAKRQLEKKKDV